VLSEVTVGVISPLPQVGSVPLVFSTTSRKRKDISMLAEERNEMLVEIRVVIEIGNFEEAQSGQIEGMIDYSSMINNEFVPDEADQPPASPRYA
jgi:hypothetical protein